MSKSTRRLVFLSVVVVLLTIPAEVLLLRALAVPDQKQAVRDWAMSLDSRRLETETARIEAYPVLYRRELLRASTPAGRAGIWRAHVDRYLQARPSLDTNAVLVIRSLRAILTPDLFDVATDAQKQNVQALGDQLVTLVGHDEAAYLLVHLGPPDGTFASFEPTAMYLTNQLRALFVASAQGYTCDCLASWGCYNFGNTCETGGVCSPGWDWPDCGFLMMSECDGVCMAGW